MFFALPKLARLGRRRAARSMSRWVALECGEESAHAVDEQLRRYVEDSSIAGGILRAPRPDDLLRVGRRAKSRVVRPHVRARAPRAKPIRRKGSRRGTRACARSPGRLADDPHEPDLADQRRRA
jgi:hypothetical protein